VSGEYEELTPKITDDRHFLSKIWDFRKTRCFVTGRSHTVIKPMHSFVPWYHFFKSCPSTKLQGLIVFLQSTCWMLINLCVFFSVNCLICVLFTGIL